MDSTRPDPALRYALEALEQAEGRLDELERQFRDAEAAYELACQEVLSARQEALRLARKMFGLLDGK